MNTKRFWLQLPLLLLFLWGLWLMADIVLPYLKPPFRSDIGFLASKLWAVDSLLWMGAFYVHIISSLLVLALGAFLVWPAFLRLWPLWHRRLGKAYVVLLLVFAAPSGCLMAFWGNAGWAARLGLLAQAFCWFLLTAAAYVYIRRGDWRAHQAMMWRSYALSFSAISLRLMMTAFALLDNILDYPLSYIAACWWSWVFNLLLLEAFLRLRFSRGS